MPNGLPRRDWNAGSRAKRIPSTRTRFGGPAVSLIRRDSIATDRRHPLADRRSLQQCTQTYAAQALPKTLAPYQSERDEPSRHPCRRRAADPRLEATDEVRLVEITQLAIENITATLDGGSGSFALVPNRQPGPQCPWPLLGSITLVARLECADLSLGLVTVDSVNLLYRAQQSGSLPCDRSQLLVTKLEPARLHRTSELRPVALRQCPVHIYHHKGRRRGAQPTPVRGNLLSSDPAAAPAITPRGPP